MQTLEKNTEMFLNQTERIQKALKGTYTQEQVDLLFEKVKRFKTNHLEATIEHLIMTKTFLPPIGEIEAGCRVEAYGDEQKEDREEKQFARNFFDGKVTPKGNMAREAMKLILNILTVDKEGFFLKSKPKMTVPELNQEMLKMDEKYPVIGWRENANLMMEIRAKRIKQTRPQLELVEAVK